MKQKQKDSSTFRQKVSLRLAALRELEETPLVLETHGGAGKLFSRCYAHLPTGVVFEVDEDKAEILTEQRPGWAVYLGDCVSAISSGVGLHHKPNFIDCDPYGECWPVLDALFSQPRLLSDLLVLVVNDGLRNKLHMNTGWACRSMKETVKRHGNNHLFEKYLNICRELVEEKSAQAGYTLKRWTGYHCGHGNDMTHFAAVLCR